MRFPLRAFLFLALSVVTLAPIAYLGPTQIARWRNVQHENADKELRMAAESLARAVGMALDGNIRDLTSTANQIGIHGDFDQAQLKRILRQFREAFPICFGINVSNLEGRPIVSDPDLVLNVQYTDRDYYREMRRTGRTAVSDVEIGRLRKVPSIHMAAPIWKGDGATATMTGALVNAVGLDHLQELCSKSVLMFGDMAARVLDRRRHLIVDSKEGGLSPLTDLAAVDLYATPPGGVCSLRTGKDLNGTEVRAAVASIPDQGLGWTVVVLRPLAAIESEASRARATTLVAFCGALVLGIMFSYLLSSWLARPISRLAAYTSLVARGDDVPAPAAATWDAREVTDLIGTVAAMVSRLREQTETIRRREEERVVLARAKREMEIAGIIQTGILPRDLSTAGFQIAGVMKPAETIGGDYYEILPAPSGYWISVGDVSGHGLNAGLVMLMLQSAIGALALHAHQAGPAEILSATNQILVENIRRRLRGDDHVTIVLAHLHDDGRLVFSGGHEPLIILRKGARQCEVHEVEGPWLGIKADLHKHLEEHVAFLGPGDLLICHSDGIVEAGASQHNLFGLERLCASIERLRDLPVAQMCTALIDEALSWSQGRAQEDDMTIVIIRRNEQPASGA